MDYLTIAPLYLSGKYSNFDPLFNEIIHSECKYLFHFLLSYSILIEEQKM
jgi:hypothetical protein